MESNSHIVEALKKRELDIAFQDLSDASSEEEKEPPKEFTKEPKKPAVAIGKEADKEVKISRDNDEEEEGDEKESIANETTPKQAPKETHTSAGKMNPPLIACVPMDPPSAQSKGTVKVKRDITEFEDERELLQAEDLKSQGVKSNHEVIAKEEVKEEAKAKLEVNHSNVPHAKHIDMDKYNTVTKGGSMVSRSHDQKLLSKPIKWFQIYEYILCF